MKKIVFTISLIFTFSSAIFSQIPTDGLVGYWSFSGDANDESGNGNNGTVNGATLTADRFGNDNSAYSFDGINDWINMPQGSSTSLNITSDFCVAYWFKTNQGIISGQIGFGDNIDGTNGGYLIALGNALPNAAGKITVFTDNVWRSGKTILNDNVWHYACVNLLGNSLTVYIDHKIDTIFSNVNAPTSFSGLRAIGSRNNGLAGYFYGLLDDIRVYNRALDSTEIQSLYLEHYCFETIYDTITTEVFDTTYVTVYDTIPVYDSIAVTDTLIINAVLTGIDPPENINTLKIYPNPAKDHLYINTGDYGQMNGYQLKIIDQTGAVVFETNVEEPLYEINLSTWSGYGLYFVQVIDSGGGVIDIRKVILE